MRASIIEHDRNRHTCLFLISHDSCCNPEVGLAFASCMRAYLRTNTSLCQDTYVHVICARMEACMDSGVKNISASNRIVKIADT